MANRVTAAEVKEIIDTTLTESQIAPFITAANITITDILGATTVLSSDQLKEIERWLSAHFVAIRDPRISAEKIADASATYQGKTAMGLDSTTYGQQAKMLDTTGALANIGKKKASMNVLDFIDGGT
jgi:hypothetical protein